MYTRITQCMKISQWDVKMLPNFCNKLTKCKSGERETPKWSGFIAKSRHKASKTYFKNTIDIDDQ